jgi:hypothetical protein
MAQLTSERARRASKNLDLEKILIEDDRRLTDNSMNESNIEE